MKPSKISVLLKPDEFLRFDSFCVERGYKKSTLIARLIKDHLEREEYFVGGQMDSLKTLENESEKEK